MKSSPISIKFKRRVANDVLVISACADDASINQESLLGLLPELVPSPVALDLVRGSLQLMVDEDGVLRPVDVGIGLGFNPRF